MTPWTVAHQAPLSMEFSRQEYWSELLLPSPGNLADPGIEPGSPALQADSLPFELQGRKESIVVSLGEECSDAQSEVLTQEDCHVCYHHSS